MSSISYLPLFIVTCGTTLVLSSCDSGSSNMNVDVTPRKGAIDSKDKEMRVRQSDFLNRIRASDPEARVIDRAIINEQNELGLILDHSVDMAKIPALMRTMLMQMAREFPGQDLTVLAYTPSNPPQKIGTARLNAKTSDMTYTAEH